MVTRTTLDTGWTLAAVAPSELVPLSVQGQTIAAEVPGCVHTDLLRAGLLADPYLVDNEDKQRWIARTTWRYDTVVTADAQRLDGAARQELWFDGLDTIAEIRLNGELVARTENMHRRYRFDVTELLHEGDNALTVLFHDVYAYAAQVREQFGEYPSTYEEPFNYVRKMASNFGWDWGPTLVTAGIWQQVQWVTWQDARLDAVRPLVTVDRSGETPAGRVVAEVSVDLQDSVDLQVSVDLQDSAADALRLTVSIGGQQTVVPVSADQISATVDLAQVDLWWPVGFGEQPLYDLSVELHDGDRLLDSWQSRVGFREVVLHTEPDDIGTPFEIHVNGTAVLIRGVNWIPDDCFPTRVSPQRYAERLDQALAANVNLIRVWGGGLYERQGFYDYCDAKGLLVWQDFLFACAAYPEGEPYRSEVEAEARDNIVRLAPHPSLILWNGNNENIWGYEDWGWKEILGDRPWGLGYYLGLLPELMAELDPTRPYWPGSPYSGKPDIYPNDPAHANVHIWDVWNQVDYTEYGRYQARFVSEFGFQGPANWATIVRSENGAPVLGKLHQKADRGEEKLRDGMRPHLPAPRTGDVDRELADWHYLTQLNQARAVAFGIEHFRSQWPRCAGTIVWQLNDCWPVTSWAAIDGDGRLKPLWYALRRAYEPRLLTITTSAGALPVVHLVNNSPEAWQSTLRVERQDLNGKSLGSDEYPIDLAPAARYSVPVEPGDRSVITARIDGRIVRHFSAEDIELDLPAPRMSTQWAAAADGTGIELTVVAETFLRDLVVVADRVDPAATVDEQLINLLPGEQHVFHITTSVSVDDPAWRGPYVVRCVNDVTAQV